MAYTCPPFRPCHLPTANLASELATVVTSPGRDTDLLVEAIRRLSEADKQHDYDLATWLKYKAERDDARRSLCEEVERTSTDPETAREIAAANGWDDLYPDEEADDE